LDKNCSYSLVGAGKERSGFHGTTIQTVIPKPSRIVVSDKQAETYNSTDRQTDITDFKVKSVHSEISAWVSFKSEGDKWENLFWIKLGGGPTLSTGLIKLSTIPGFSFLSRIKLLMRKFRWEYVQTLFLL
jgi:hypothetical protein